MIKLATWNVNSVRKRIDTVCAWLERNEPDALCLQETKVVDEDFPHAAIKAAGYHVVCHGQKTYNGVAICSREPAAEVSRDLRGLDDGHARIIEGTVAGVRLLCAYVPNGGSDGHDSQKMKHKFDFLLHLSWRLGELRDEHPVVVATGDFNVAPDDGDVYDIDDWGHDSNAVSPAEREAYAGLLEAGFEDAKHILGQRDGDFTWWDYRRDSFPNDRGLRIDHFLVAGGECRSLVVDRETRSRPEPSDHAPVILELEV